jgi:hypothetical protein
MNPKLLLALLLFGFCPTVAQTPLTALSADKPSPQYQDQLMLFGQFVGVWDFDGVEYHSDGTRPTDKGEIHFAWVLQGRAIQDVWIERERTDKNALVYGATVRFYDPNIDAWRVTWMDPVNCVVSTLIGRKVADEIIIEGKAADGAPTRWIFSEIKQNSFHWRGEKLVDKTWRIYEELSARRKK